MDEQTAFILAQCISVGTGILAIALKQMKTMKMILLFEVIVNLLASTNYLLLGGDAGAIVSVLAILHSFVMLTESSSRKPLARTVQRQTMSFWLFLVIILQWLSHKILIISA